MIPRLIAALAAVAIINGCASWVELEPGAEHVELATADEVADCERVGRATVSVAERVGSFQRSPGKVDEELAVLARNSAPHLGGDTVVADGSVEDGRQHFIVYRCRQ